MPLILETKNPSLGILAPSLSPWRVSEAKPKPPIVVPMTAQPSMPTYISYPTAPVMIPAMYRRSRSRSRSRSRRSRSPRAHRHSARSSRSTSPIPMTRVPMMQHQATVAVTDKGSATATYRIPGHVDIPSDAQEHSVTIGTIELKATFLWRTIPKIDTRVYMTV